MLLAMTIKRSDEYKKLRYKTLEPIFDISVEAHACAMHSRLKAAPTITISVPLHSYSVHIGSTVSMRALKSPLNPSLPPIVFTIRGLKA